MTLALETVPRFLVPLVRTIERARIPGLTLVRGVANAEAQRIAIDTLKIPPRYIPTLRALARRGIVIAS